MVQGIQNKGFHARFSPQYLSAYSQRRGWSRWVGTPNALWISKRRTKAALTGCRAALPPSKLLKMDADFNSSLEKFQLGAFKSFFQSDNLEPEGPEYTCLQGRVSFVADLV